MTPIAARLLKVAIALGAIVSVPAAFVTTCYYMENPTSRYKTYQEARAAGALDEGRWIPAFLPESSRSIVETHDIDTNALEIEFDYTPGDLGRVPVECRRTSSSSEYVCEGWGMPLNVRLDDSGKGLVLGHPNYALERAR